jgi:integrase
MHPFLPPMVATAAYTGMRRSELLRARPHHLDMPGRLLTVVEKKRLRGRTTNRTLPLSRRLAATLNAWLEARPAGEELFCLPGVLLRSSKRRGEPAAITRDEINPHLRNALKGTPWSVIRGWHVFRHSFISACAARGLDAPTVQKWVGHMSPEMLAHYVHLSPATQRAAMDRVFG